MNWSRDRIRQTQAGCGRGRGNSEVQRRELGTNPGIVSQAVTNRPASVPCSSQVSALQVSQTLLFLPDHGLGGERPFNCNSYLDTLRKASPLDGNFQPLVSQGSVIVSERSQTFLMGFLWESASHACFILWMISKVTKWPLDTQGGPSVKVGWMFSTNTTHLTLLYFEGFLPCSCFYSNREIVVRSVCMCVCAHTCERMHVHVQEHTYHGMSV